MTVTAIQPHQELPAKATFKVLTDVRKGDLFFLCSDGVIEKLEDDLCQILTEKLPLEKRLEKLKQEALQRDTRDNNSAYLIEVTEVSGTSMKSEIQSDSTTQQDETNPKIVDTDKKSRPNWLRWFFLLLTILALALAAFFMMKAKG